MYIKKSKHLVDVFLDLDKQTTGFEPESWLRLSKTKDGRWVQLAGVKLPSWQFKQLTMQLN